MDFHDVEIKKVQLGNDALKARRWLDNECANQRAVSGVARFTAGR